MCKPRIPVVVPLLTARLPNMYFHNDVVEELLRQYLFRNCTSVTIRDQIMEHATELIRQIIRVHALHRISNTDEDELIQIGWIQIERTLYKYKASIHCADCYRPDIPSRSYVYQPAQLEYGLLLPEDVAERGLVCAGCKKHPSRIMYRGISKCFNLWSSIARTAMLAYIKKSTRDARYSGESYHGVFLKRPAEQRNLLHEFFESAKGVLRHDPVDLRLLGVLRQLFDEGSSHLCVIRDLTSRGQVSRARVQQFLFRIRLEMGEFGDALGERQLVMGDVMGV